MMSDLREHRDKGPQESKNPPSGRDPLSDDERGDLSIRVDGKQFRVDGPKVSGAEILQLVGKTPDDWCLFQRCRDGLVHVEPDDIVDISAPGIERFRTRKPIGLCIEDKTIPWCNRTITTEQIANLGGWDVSQGVIEVDADQNERTLAPGEVIKLRPGQQFGKKHCWKRG